MSLDFEGTPIDVRPGDSVASAVYRSGVRTFSRSFKYHRRRGLYCMSGDCANCLLEVNGESDVRSCLCKAEDGMRVRRQGGMPNVERDLIGINDRMHWAFPSGFYYKALIKPKWAWPKAEPIIRRVAGRGRVNLQDVPRDLERVHRHPDVLVIGMGPAGLSAALGAAAAGKRVLAVDESEPGWKLPPGPAKDAVERLLAEARSQPLIEVAPSHIAIGIYEGAEVPVIGPDLLLMVHPAAIVVATGAHEQNVVFGGNEIPNVFLGRGAARLSASNGIKVGSAAVVLGGTHEAAAHAAALRAQGTAIAAVVLPDGADDAGFEGARIIRGRLHEAHGRKAVSAVTVELSHGGTERIDCDVVALSAAFTPQENLLRQTVSTDPIWAAGDVISPGPVDDVVRAAREVGAQAAGGQRIELPAFGATTKACGTDGYVCICYDVTVAEVERSVKEGFRSTELLKRYTTATMGACQGRLCHGQLRELAGRFSPGGDPIVAGPTTARPPARPLRMEEAVAGNRHHLERRTALHDVHLGLGARFLWAGQWKRVEHYGKPNEADLTAIHREYKAVREGVGMIDVGTLGKFTVAGPDVVAFLEKLYPNRVADLEPGRLRYGLMLDEGGVIHDDGTICRVADDRFYLTVTTSGAEEAEAVMMDWRESWGHDVHIVNQTSALGAINVAGPRAREVLQKLTQDDVSKEAFPYLRHRRITVAGIPCTAIRLGFVGELGWELHHPSSRSEELWDALMEAGADAGITPFGIQAQRLLRLEKGHIIVSQDTDFETTPWHVGMDWAVKLDKDDFVGKAALVRKKDRKTEKLVGFKVDAGAEAPWEGAAVKVDGVLSGRVASSWYSPTLGYGVGLAWVPPERAVEGQRVTLGIRDAGATVMFGAFYDPEGEKLRA
jgi:sarcosine oxidase subunit alpha